VALSIPTDVKFNALASVGHFKATALTFLLVTSPDQTDTAASTTVYSQYSGADALSDSSWQQVLYSVRTNTSAQIRLRSNVASTAYEVITLGWIDSRERNA
jgi:hypothetical protein